MSDKKTVFETLNAIDFKQHIKALQGNPYIPWADAWLEVKKSYPLAWYEVLENDVGDPFFVSLMGIFVKVRVHIGGEEPQTLNYPVMNGANKALKAEAYSYSVKEYKWDAQRNKNIPTGKMVEKFVEPATTFDINTAHMRALTKCLALKGAALYIYRDEAMPDEEKVSSSQLQEITALCKKYNYMIGDIAKQFGNYAKIADIPESKFDDFIVWATPK